MDIFKSNTKRKSQQSPEARAHSQTLAEKSEVDELRTELAYIRQQMETLMPIRSSDREGGSLLNTVGNTGKEAGSNTRSGHTTSQQRGTGNRGSSTPALRSPERDSLEPTARHYTPKPSSQSPKLDKELEDLRVQLELQTIENQRLERDLKALQRENQKLVRSNDDLQKKLSTALDCFQHHLASKERSLTTTTDAVSVANLKKKVDLLNARINQVVATLVETMSRKQPSELDEDALTFLNVVPGKPIADLLSRERHLAFNVEPNRFVAQIALQVFLVHMCASGVEEWSLQNATLSKILAEIYVQVQRTNKDTPAASRRWRASAREHVRPNFTGDYFKKHILWGMSHIYAAAAWELPSGQQKQAVLGQLTKVFETLQDLRDTIMEQIVSTEILPCFIRADSPFVGDLMDNSFDDALESDSKRPNERVAGTVGLGLRQIGEARDDQGNLTCNGLLLPKVILTRTLLKPLAVTSADSGSCGKA